MNPLDVAVLVEQCWQPVPGGSATYVVELLRAFRERDDLRIHGLAAAHREWPGPDLRPDCPITRAPLPRRALYEAWNRVGLPRAEAMVRHRLDVVHAPTWAVPATRRPLVVTVHDLAFLRDPSHFTSRGVRFFTRALSRIRDEATTIVVPSLVTAQDCVAAGIDRDRIVTIPHGVRIERPAPQAVEGFRRRHGLTRPYVLWTGTHEPRKNLPILLEAFELLAETCPDVELVLVGPGGWGAPTTKRSDGRTHVLGRLGWPDLQLAYAGAAAFCFPSLWEGFGMPVLEAMAHRVPVVTSRGTSMAEITGPHGLLVEPTDAAALAVALERVLGPEGVALGARGHARAAEYTWRAAADRTAEVYREAAGRGV